MTKIQLVDENDTPLRPGTMDEAQMQAIWHRIARVMVFNEKGDMLLQLRSENEFSYPDCWDLTVGGHVDADEEYLVAAKREAMEEVGAALGELVEVDYYKSSWVDNERTYNRFNKTYKAVVPSQTSFHPSPEEVKELRWFSKDELVELVDTDPGRITDGLRDFVLHVLV